MRRITKTIIWIGVGGVLYFLSSNHFVYFGDTKVKLLKKKRLTLSRTFFSTELKTNEMILADDVLREAGIGDLLIDMGLMSTEQRDRIMAKFEKKKKN